MFVLGGKDIWMSPVQLPWKAIVKTRSGQKGFVYAYPKVWAFPSFLMTCPMALSLFSLEREFSNVIESQNGLS